MKLKIAQVIGLNTDLKAAQVLSQARNGDNSFFAVLDLDSDDAFTKGRQFLSELSDFYFDSESTSSGEKLKTTYDEAQKKLATKDASGAVSEYGLLLASISGKVLYLIGKGAVEAYLKRAEKVSSLLSVGAPDQLISGFLTESDKILLSTKSLISLLGEDLGKCLKIPLDNFEEDITDRIGTSDLKNQCLAALIVEIEEDSVDVPAIEESTVSELPTSVSYKSDSDLIPQETSFESKSNPLLALKTVLTNTLAFIWQLKRFFPKSGRAKLITAIVLIVIITIGVGFKIKATKDNQKNAQFNQILQESKDDYNAAKGLASLNPVEAKNKLDSALTKANSALSLKPGNIDAQNLKKQIETDSGSILQQFKVTDFPLFLDMDLVKNNFRAQNLSLSTNKLLLLDPAVKTLVAIDIAKKSNQILSGSAQLGDAQSSSLNGGLAFIASKDKGILKIDTTNSKLTTVAKSDSEIGQIADIYGFGGNIYVVDSIKNQIWKYLPTADGYSDKRAYLTSDTKADLSNSIRMQIESSVYVLKKDGEILRFTKGEKDNFSIGGLDKGIKDPKSFFVSSDTDNLYLLDSGNSRLLILTKTGAYKSQMTGDKFATATDLVVDEQAKKVYLLDGGKIYSVDLK